VRQIAPSFHIEFGKPKEEMYRNLEAIGRTCYKSDKPQSADSSVAFIKRLISSGHESVIEHEIITVRMIIDRGISHELVRHRIASFSQESSRYCNYNQDKFGREISVIKPCSISYGTAQYLTWEVAVNNSESAYMSMVEKGFAPEVARSVLPTCLKTEVVVTMNLREWRHFFTLRCAKPAHPDMRYIANLMLEEFKVRWSEVFEDIESYPVVAYYSDPASSVGFTDKSGPDGTSAIGTPSTPT
jgi:thymidylate synthase (FAD)